MRDRHTRCGLVEHLREVGALDAVLGVVECVEVTRRQRGDCLRADEHPCVLDDLEHLRDAVVDVAHEVADGRVFSPKVSSHVVGDLMPIFGFSMFVDAVALAELAGLRVEEELRNDEQAQPLVPARRLPGGRARGG